jgi:hypothetical protein
MPACRRRLPAFAIALLAAAPLPAAPHGRSHAVSTLALPATSAAANSFALDLNGDGHPDNAFGNVLAVFSGGVGLDLTTPTVAAVAAGTIVFLVEVRSQDPAFAQDNAAEATWYVGEPEPQPPLFDGTDTFRFDANYPPGRFVAPLAGGAFVSANPVTTNAPVELVLQLRLGSATVPLPLQGARLKFTTTPAGLAGGQVNGSIREEDIDNVFVPALAVMLNDMVQANPGTPTTMTLLGLFDTNPTDGAISVDEVATNPLFSSVLRPDVDIFDAGGNYAPNPANTSPDAMSLGFGFTAVASQAQLPRIFGDGFDG